MLFLASAYLISAGKISMAAAILIATAGSTIGGYITYLLGSSLAPSAGAARVGGGPRPVGPAESEAAARDDGDASASGLPTGKRRPPLLGRFWTDPVRLGRVRKLVGRYGALLALLARWMGVLRPAALLGTGMARVKPWKVLPALFVGSLVYCAVYQLLAEAVAAVSLRLLGQVDAGWLLVPAVGLALAWLAGMLLLRRVRM